MSDDVVPELYVNRIGVGVWALSVPAFMATLGTERSDPPTDLRYDPR